MPVLLEAVQGKDAPVGLAIKHLECGGLADNPKRATKRGQCFGDCPSGPDTKEFTAEDAEDDTDGASARERRGQCRERRGQCPERQTECSMPLNAAPLNGCSLTFPATHRVMFSIRRLSRMSCESAK